MRTFLLLILIAVISVLLWAVWSKTFINTGVFVLSLTVTSLCGYLLADYFFNNVKKRWMADIDLYKKEITAIKEENDVLQKQISSAIPQSEVDELKSQLKRAEEEKRRLNGEFLAQAATISQLNTRLDKMQSEYNEIQEDSTLTSESRLTEIEAIRDTLAITKAKLTELAAENEGLKNELARFKSISEKTGDIPDDLKMVEGIGSKVDALLQEQGITTWKALSQTSVENLRDILNNAGERYEIHDPTTWPEQARLLMNGDWETFNEYIHDLRLAKVRDSDDKILTINELNISAIGHQNPPPSVTKGEKVEKVEAEIRFLNEKEKSDWTAQSHHRHEVSIVENESKSDDILTQNKVPLTASETPQAEAIYVEEPKIDVPKIEEPIAENPTLNEFKIDSKLLEDAEKDPEILALLEDLEPLEVEIPIYIKPSAPILTSSTALENPDNTAESVGDLPTQEAIPAYSSSSPSIVLSPDDLKVIGGIGPKIEALLKEAGIVNWQQLSECSYERLRSILDKAGNRYRLNDPSTWAEQAHLLQVGDIDKFKEMNTQVYISK